VRKEKGKTGGRRKKGCQRKEKILAQELEKAG
jgi:hypothetical protein